MADGNKQSRRRSRPIEARSVSREAREPRPPLHHPVDQPADGGPQQQTDRHDGQDTPLQGQFDIVDMRAKGFVQAQLQGTRRPIAVSGVVRQRV